MTHYDSVPDPAPFENLEILDVGDLMHDEPAYPPSVPPSSVFPGKPYMAGTDTELLDIFDELSEAVSVELRNLGLNGYVDANPEGDY